ncbi:hypothetical protein ACIOZM_20490 [Pseudomonas sp. NPDC087346]
MKASSMANGQVSHEVIQAMKTLSGLFGGTGIKNLGVSLSGRGPYLHHKE